MRKPAKGHTNQSHGRFATKLAGGPKSLKFVGGSQEVEVIEVIYFLETIWFSTLNRTSPSWYAECEAIAVLGSVVAGTSCEGVKFGQSAAVRWQHNHVFLFFALAITLQDLRTGRGDPFLIKLQPEATFGAERDFFSQYRIKCSP